LLPERVLRHLAKAKKELAAGTISSLRCRGVGFSKAIPFVGKKLRRLIISGKSIRDFPRDFTGRISNSLSLYLS